MKKEEKRNKADGLIVLLLFAVFAVCVLLLLLTGANIYQKVTRADQANYERRTGVQYLTTRIRQADVQGGLRAGKFEENDALILTEEIAGEIYETFVYCYDGYIRELFASPDSGLSPKDGDKILKACSMQVWEKDGMLKIEILSADGSCQEIWLSFRSGKEVSS